METAKENKTRSYTIGRTPGTKEIPCIIISGKFLLNLGFSIRDTVVMIPQKDGTLTITKAAS